MLQALKSARTGTSYWARSAIYADRSIIVLNKPAGLICQGSDTSSENKPRDFDKFNDLLRDVKQYFNLESLPCPVHRLDKATTGTLLLARSSPAARQLSQQFQSRVVGKTYLALVRGGEKSFPARSGEIRDALEFNDGRVSIGESCAAKFTATDWELLASSPTAPLSLLRLTLHTGLKHQLRIHLAHSLHTPILGDNVYARSSISEKIAKITRLPEKRIFLHAAQLTLSRYKKTGPSKHFRLGIGAPLPRDFLTICRDAEIPLDPTYVDGGLFVDGQGVDDIPDLEGRWLRKPPVPRS
ncbi:pseudouridine synthase [Rhizopogon vinicolor AM-OR11-026]|uniref:Pseudouridine synthase n=1 Tax=Rhizopogon vinicolor AM-OR11-026 TaxID=1314800 RepID=A0A1B7MZ00_9AGAM|nr:pseudouridine synthase [Rhizopogon vinicolor AM-OR11-026]